MKLRKMNERVHRQSSVVLDVLFYHIHCCWVLTFNADTYVLQPSFLQQGFGHISVLNVLKEPVEFGAVYDFK